MATSSDEILAEIAALPETVVTYAEYVRREEATSRDADEWLRRQLEGLGNEGE